MIGAMMLVVSFIISILLKDNQDIMIISIKDCEYFSYAIVL